MQNAASTNGDVYVSIIPFSKDVNVGSSNYNANWIDWNDWEDNNGMTRRHDRVRRSKPARTVAADKNRCTTTTTWVPANHNTWNGCITDRDQDYDQNRHCAKPDRRSLPADKLRRFIRPSSTAICPLAMMGLSYNWTAMNSLVDQMYPNGNTNQPIGLVWGWLSLVGGGPLTAPAKDSNYTVPDVIILMSDGLNTEDRWSTRSQTPIDNRMYQTRQNGSGTCANIKAAGITIYTIQVNTGGDPMSTLLQNCASVPDKFCMVTSSSGLGTVFNTIGTNLTKLRVAK